MSQVVTLGCAVVGTGEIFAVDVSLDDSVHQLKQKIHAANSRTMRCDAGQLALFIAKRDNGTWPRQEDADLWLMPTEVCGTLPRTAMTPLAKLREYLEPDFEAGEEAIHVLVDVPDANPRPRKRISTDSSHIDGSAEWSRRFHHSAFAATALPSLNSLVDLIELPLPVKIGLDPSTFGKLRNVHHDIVERLFQCDPQRPCQQLWADGFHSVLHPLSPTGTTKAARAGFWDSIIRQPLQAVFQCQATTNRYASRQRPDMVFDLESVCVFRGEEDDPNRLHAQLPRHQLSEKITWIFGKEVPYVFGYAASRCQCALYAIHLNSADRNKVETMQLGIYDTQNTTQRFAFVLAVLQLSRLFDGIVRLSPCGARGEFGDLACPNGLVISMDANCVVKNFTEFDRTKGSPVDSLQLRKIYTKLNGLGIPNMDCLTHVSLNGLKLTFCPRGVDAMPSSVEEILIALECILKALVPLHAAGWMHRDIRPSNVIQYRRSEPAWFLIDFTDAAEQPQRYPSGTYLTHNEHAPEMFVEGGHHTTAVDLWSVGQLISAWDTKYLWWSSHKRGAFVWRLTDSDPAKRPTAAEALALLQELKREYEATK